MKRFLKFAVRILVLAIVAAAFWRIPFCWVAVKAQGLVWGLLATLLFGRFFCDSLCPLGILQSLVGWLRHPRRHVRRVCTRLPETKVQRIVRWSLLGVLVALGAAGFMGPVTCLVPISIVGKVLSNVHAVVESWGLPLAQVFDTPEALVFAIFSLVGFLTVLALSLFGKGRFWCNWLCPFGTLFTLVSRLSLRKDKVGAGCANCRACFAAASCPNAKKDDEAPAEKAAGCKRREVLKGVAVLAVTEKLTDGGYADVSLPGLPARKAVLPPGAGKRSTFAVKCSACQLCAANCPGGCLKPSPRLGTFGQPELDFRKGSCIATCVKCGEVCAEGAIRKLQSVQRRHVHMGRAVWKRDLCVRTKDKVACTACVRKCPVQAIHLVKGIPVVDDAACIGCGACEHVCPARPMPAIYVEGYDEQRVVRPVSAADVRAERTSPSDAATRFEC